MVERAWVFGSRALGTFKESSDIDIALSPSYLKLQRCWLHSLTPIT
ncbi:nucleotidyltransferase domain-containing protein [Vibrio aestuarianus]|nr:nucleotidyltransferase domain-containing protein [Vibrio aestuarianus]